MKVFRKICDHIPVPDSFVTGSTWLKKNYRGCLVSIGVLLGVAVLVWARGDLSSPRIAFAHADAKAMAQGIFGGMKDKLGEMAKGIEAALAENAKTNVEVGAIKGRVTKIEQSPTMSSDDLSREIKKLMDTIQLKIDQKVPVSEYQNDKKLLAQKVSMLESVLNSVVGKANAQSAPQQPQAPPAPAKQPEAAPPQVAQPPASAPAVAPAQAKPEEQFAPGDYAGQSARFNAAIKYCKGLSTMSPAGRDSAAKKFESLKDTDFQDQMWDCYDPSWRVSGKRDLRARDNQQRAEPTALDGKGGPPKGYRRITDIAVLDRHLQPVRTICNGKGSGEHVWRTLSNGARARYTCP